MHGKDKFLHFTLFSYFYLRIHRKSPYFIGYSYYISWSPRHSNPYSANRSLLLFVDFSIFMNIRAKTWCAITALWFNVETLQPLHNKHSKWPETSTSLMATWFLKHKCTLEVEEKELLAVDWREACRFLKLLNRSEISLLKWLATILLPTKPPKTG